MRRIPAAQRRQELIAAAIRVIVRGGVSALTTRAVAAEANMPLGTIHYIFESQDDLMGAVVDAVTEEERIAAESTTMESASVEEAVRDGLEAYIAVLERDPTRELAVLELGLFARRNDTAGRMRAQWSGYYVTATELLEAAAARGGAEWTVPVSDLARSLIAALDGITTTFLADGDGVAARSTAAFFASAFTAHTRTITKETPHAH
ncbi:AcrR family transcriptional regulator [Microbacterium halimionae]|uniref:AcrR family transcriptional regulator n=1 Tax=Microbacterium halimionae TaxID=1526413 RepID=A0A7W3PL83_9MICO|nr:TetR family transcriptional regulator [Microbacterium halimionae]MBA8816300.1 AcrR family transcriptional regulator [Microbacterium halimionae]NII96503.1 AcrR family transcriptional regulator [Microbacterium halimionae]